MRFHVLRQPVCYAIQWPQKRKIISVLLLYVSYVSLMGESLCYCRTVTLGNKLSHLLPDVFSVKFIEKHRYH